MDTWLSKLALVNSISNSKQFFRFHFHWQCKVFYRELSRLHGACFCLRKDWVKWCYRERIREACIGMGRSRTNTTCCGMLHTWTGGPWPCPRNLSRRSSRGEKGNGSTSLILELISYRLQFLLSPILAQWQSNDYSFSTRKEYRSSKLNYSKFCQTNIHDTTE